MKSNNEPKTASNEEEGPLLTRECRLFRVEGRVQGVWFRESARREAQALGITGYAQNMADGSVQILACGELGELGRLAQWLKQGPSMARVDRLEWVISATECPDSFVTR